MNDTTTVTQNDPEYKTGSTNERLLRSLYAAGIAMRDWLSQSPPLPGSHFAKESEMKLREMGYTDGELEQLVNNWRARLEKRFAEWRG